MADSTALRSTSAQGPSQEMEIIGESRDRTRFRLRCKCGAEFTQPRHSISAECPECGAMALMIDLATEFHCRASAA